MKALIVDDSRSMRSMLGRVVTEIGFTVQEAADGDAALAMLGAQPDIQLLLVDFNMPGMSGLELIERARALPPKGPLKILMVTSELAAIERALAAGADEFIMKPFESDAARERIMFVVGSS